MRPSHLRSLLAALAVFTFSAPLAAQEPTFTSDESGFTFGVTGIDEVDAVIRAFDGAADGDALVDQGLVGNRVEEHGIERRNLIEASFAGNRGILSVNQESGNLNNQANVRVVVLTAAAGSQLQVLDSSAQAQRRGNVFITSGGEREDRIADSFGDTRGIVGVNQSSGNLNQQVNVLVLGVEVSFGSDLVALGDSSLAQVSTETTLLQEDPAFPRHASIERAFGGFAGIAQVSQSPGDLNTVNNTLGVSLAVRNIP